MRINEVAKKSQFFLIQTIFFQFHMEEIFFELAKNLWYIVKITFLLYIVKYIFFENDKKLFKFFWENIVDIA